MDAPTCNTVGACFHPQQGVDRKMGRQQCGPPLSLLTVFELDLDKYIIIHLSKR